MPDIGNFIRRSRRSAKIAIAAPGAPGDFRRSRRSAYKIAKCVAGLSKPNNQICKSQYFLTDCTYLYIGRKEVFIVREASLRVQFKSILYVTERWDITEVLNEGRFTNYLLVLYLLIMDREPICSDLM